MTSNKKIKLKKGDIIILAAFLLLGAVLTFCFGGKEGTRAEISVNGETVCTVRLSEITEKKVIPLENGVTVTAEPGAIYFSSSPCGGQDCVRTGRLTKAGQCAVCLPEKTVIKVFGDADKNTPDAIT